MLLSLTGLLMRLFNYRSIWDKFIAEEETSLLTKNYDPVGNKDKYSDNSNLNPT